MFGIHLAADQHIGADSILTLDTLPPVTILRRIHGHATTRLCTAPGRLGAATADNRHQAAPRGKEFQRFFNMPGARLGVSTVLAGSRREWGIHDYHSGSGGQSWVQQTIGKQSVFGGQIREAEMPQGGLSALSNFVDKNVL